MFLINLLRPATSSMKICSLPTGTGYTSIRRVMMRYRFLLFFLSFTVLAGCDFFVRLNPTWGEGDAEVFLYAVGGSPGVIENYTEETVGDVTMTTGISPDGSVMLSSTETVQSASLTVVSKTVTLNDHQNNSGEGILSVSGRLKVVSEIGSDEVSYEITGTFTVDSEQIVFSTAVIDLDMTIDKDSRRSIEQTGTLNTDVKDFDITTIMDFEIKNPDESWMNGVI